MRRDGPYTGPMNVWEAINSVRVIREFAERPLSAEHEAAWPGCRMPQRPRQITTRLLLASQTGAQAAAQWPR